MSTHQQRANRADVVFKDTNAMAPPQWPVVTLTFDLQNPIRSSVGASEYSL